MVAAACMFVSEGIVEGVSGGQQSKGKAFGDGDTCLRGASTPEQASDGKTVDTDVDLSSIDTMQEMQELVTQLWADMMGGSMSNGMKMEYEDTDGHFVKVSKSTVIGDVTCSPAIRLLRKAPVPAKCGLQFDM